MKSKQLFKAGPLVFTLLTGCTWDEPMVPVLSTIEAPITQSNGEIIQDLLTINHNEITASQLAMHKAQHARVKHYAKLMHDQHRKNLHQVEHLSHRTGIEPVINMTTTNLKQHSKQEVTRLGSLNGTAFDKAYIKDMIDDHETALRLIDKSIVQSTNARLTRLLKDTRQEVAHHLHLAEAIQKELRV